jgi:hypothetical protein
MIPQRIKSIHYHYGCPSDYVFLKWQEDWPHPTLEAGQHSHVAWGILQEDTAMFPGRPKSVALEGILKVSVPVVDYYLLAHARLFKRFD